jgi:trk system potassium uptake protein TrkH
MKDQKLTPRITQTAKALWAIYLALTAACVGAYWLAGMNLFDAVAHAFSTISTAGFSPYDAGFAHFDNFGVQVVATVFMFLGGASFALHFTVLKRRELGAYWRDTEFKAYLLLTLAVTAFAGTYLFAMRVFPTFAECLRHAAFQVVSMQTTTGPLTDGFAHWPGALPVLLVFLSFIGGCAGSTTGGMKVIRWLVVFRQGVAELKQLVHPSAEVPVKLAGRPVPQRIILGVGGYFAMYLIVFAVLMLLLMMFDMDQDTAWYAVAASLNNVGPGIADVAMTFRDVSDSAKWVCAIAMLVGRLEIFALLLLLTPAFWER